MRIQANSSFKSLAVALAATGLLATAANAEVTTSEYGSTGNWTVSTVYDDGSFNHCRAATEYQSGIEVAFMVTRTEWLVQFFDDRWPNREKTTLELKLSVDGKTVSTQGSFFNMQSVFIQMGDQMDNMSPIAYGNVMQIDTAAGQSRFNLKGTRKAIVMAAECHATALQAESKNKAVSSNDAFGSPEPQPETKTSDAGNKPHKLDYEATLGIAKSYLEKRKIEAEILEGDARILKHFTVNWKTTAGNLGGLMVLVNAPRTTVQIMDGLIKEQDELCKGNLSKKREPSEEAGENPAQRAMIGCETQEGTNMLSYTVVELEPNVIAILLEAGFFPAEKVSRSKPNLDLSGLRG